MAEELYGAEVDGVRAFLPHRKIGETTKPSTEDVDGYIVTCARWVAMRAGDLIPGSTYYQHARGLVHLGAAAMTEEAAFPERAGKADTTYAASLWAKFQEGLKELLKALGPGADPGAGVLAFAFPDPVWRRDAGF